MGTHPIFESDFDCLTESKKMLSRRILVPITRCLKINPRPIYTIPTRAASKSDSELLNYLDDQLEHEKARNVGNIEKWSNLTVEGAIGSMSRSHGTETVTVRFNLNGAMPTLDEQDKMEADGEEPLCLPDFEVIVEKPGQKKIWVNCVFDEGPEEGANDDESDAFEIISLTIANDSTDFPYVMNMDAMDPTFYDQIFNFLEERGVTEQFVDDLATSATDAENNLYRQALEDLRSFLK